jgi:hypothetical protein
MQGDNEPLATKGNRAMYVMQCNNEPLATKSNRAAYVVQGNGKPLITESNWAIFFDNCKGAKAPSTRSITSIANPYHCNKAP